MVTNIDKSCISQQTDSHRLCEIKSIHIDVLCQIKKLPYCKYVTDSLEQVSKFKLFSNYEDDHTIKAISY